jgi:hypothetical protein
MGSTDPNALNVFALGGVIFQTMPTSVAGPELMTVGRPNAHCDMSERVALECPAAKLKKSLSPRVNGKLGELEALAVPLSVQGPRIPIPAPPIFIAELGVHVPPPSPFKSVARLPSSVEKSAPGMTNPSYQAPFKELTQECATDQSHRQSTILENLHATGNQILPKHAKPPRHPVFRCKGSFRGVIFATCCAFCCIVHTTVLSVTV